MAHITSLPTAILFFIFNYIEAAAQLAACRLVCRGWNYPAEQCMFGKEIAIMSERQAIQLYTHLCKNPSNGNLIKHLGLMISEKKLPLIYECLMDIAFTPTIETLSGVVMSPKFFDILTSIAENYSLKFRNLKRLLGYFYDQDSYLNALTTKRLHASTLALTAQASSTKQQNWRVINHLDGFDNLKFLEIRGAHR